MLPIFQKQALFTMPINTMTVPEATTAYMVYNQTGDVKGLTNQKIRQALNLATDRKGVVEVAVDTGSKPATGIAQQVWRLWKMVKT